MSLKLQTSLWDNLHPDQVIGTAAIVKEIDCLTATVDDILNVRANILSSINCEKATFCGYAGWFDVHFRVSFIIYICVVGFFINFEYDSEICLFLSCLREIRRIQLKRK